MIEPMNAPGLGFFAATYGRVLGLLPARFRSEYGSEVRVLFREMYLDAYGRGGLRAALSFSLLAIRRVLTGAFVDRRSDSEEELPVATGPSRGPRRNRGFGERVSDSLRGSWRSVRRNPGFSVMAIVLMGLGIGATSTIFSVVDGVILRNLPYPDPDRIVYITNGSHSPLFVKQVENEMSTFSDVVAGWNRALDLIGDGPPSRVPVGWVTEGFLEFFGVTQPLFGRLFTSEDHVGPSTVAILSHHVWVERWGSDPDVLGRTMTLDGRTVEIIGVLDRSFVPPNAMLGSQVDLWTPFDLDTPEFQNFGYSILDVAGRMGPGVDIAQVEQELEGLSARIAEVEPQQYTNAEGDPYLTPPVPLHEITIEGMADTLYPLLGAVGFLLLIACVNVANLMLARGTERVQETALRGALGANRKTLVTELLFESAFISVLGGVLGIVLAYAGMAVFQSLAPGGIPRIDEVGVDWRVMAFALGSALLTGLIFGVVPSVHASATAPAKVLRSGDGAATHSRRPVDSKPASW